MTACLTHAAAAADLGITERRLHDIRRAGNIDAVNHGTIAKPCYGYTPTAIEDYLAARADGSPALIKKTEDDDDSGSP